jgi:hypothetical protein
MGVRRKGEEQGHPRWWAGNIDSIVSRHEEKIISQWLARASHRLEPWIMAAEYQEKVFGEQLQGQATVWKHGQHFASSEQRGSSIVENVARERGGREKSTDHPQ